MERLIDSRKEKLSNVEQARLKAEWNVIRQREASSIEYYNKNILVRTRQLYYGERNKNPVDTVLCINGIPVVALKLKNQ